MSSCSSQAVLSVLVPLACRAGRRQQDGRQGYRRHNGYFAFTRATRCLALARLARSLRIQFRPWPAVCWDGPFRKAPTRRGWQRGRAGCPYQPVPCSPLLANWAAAVLFAAENGPDGPNSAHMAPIWRSGLIVARPLAWFGPRRPSGRITADERRSDTPRPLTPGFLVFSPAPDPVGHGRLLWHAEEQPWSRPPPPWRATAMRPGTRGEEGNGGPQT